MKKLLLILTMLAVTVVGYGQKIEDLTRATTTNATDLLIIDQPDNTKGIELQNLYAGDNAPASDISEITIDTLDVDYLEANTIVGNVVQVSNGKLVSVNEAGDDITITTGGTFYQYTAID